MKQLSFDDVKKLADLSELRLTDDEVKSMQSDLPRIIEYVDQLGEVDTSGVEPTYQVNYTGTVTRADEPVDYSVKPADLVGLSPESKAGQLKVPRVLG